MEQLKQGNFYIVEGFYSEEGPYKIKVLETTAVTYLIQDLDNANAKSKRWKKGIFNDKFKILEELSSDGEYDISAEKFNDLFTPEKLREIYLRVEGKENICAITNKYEGGHYENGFYTGMEVMFNELSNMGFIVSPNSDTGKSTGMSIGDFRNSRPTDMYY